MSPYLPTDKEGIASANAFADTLQKLGWHDGDNLRIDYSWPGGDPALIKAAAADTVNSAPDLIVVAANAAVAEVHRLTNTIPIVFTRVADPVGSGFATSLARPEGNITGFQASDASAASGSRFCATRTRPSAGLPRFTVPIPKATKRFWRPRKWAQDRSPFR
jgi:ABC-type uncharacterized transport system substrate-binding protein